MAIADTLTSETPSTLYRRGVILCLVAGVCWSTMGLGIRFAPNATVWHVLFYRSVAMTPILFVVIAWRSGWQPIQTIHKSGKAGIIGGLGLIFAFSGGIYAVQTTTVANAMFLFATAPFFTAALSWIILKERVRRATWIAMAVALVGIGMMVSEGLAVGHGVGNVTAIAAALGFAVFALAIRWGRLGDMMPAILLGGVFSLGVSAGFIIALDLGFDLPLQDLAAILFLGVFQLGLGLTLFTFGSKHVPATELALLSLTEVVLSPVWVWLVLGETASLATLIGGAILLVALVGNALSGMRRKPALMM